MSHFKAIRPIRLTNTLTGEKELLSTWSVGKLLYYSCGPTVYNLIHIGNLRGGLVSDMFFRYFLRVGYDVYFVRNYTDVDDKIIKKANEENVSPEDLASKYISEVEKDFAAAGMLDPTRKTTVTAHIPEIIEMVKSLIEKEHAYVLESGEVLFSIDSFPTYGELSSKKLDDLIAGIRVEVNVLKRNPLDFTLWKPAKVDEPSWSSPWGRGRPGWHIECSAMACKWLGPKMDVHHGGEDLVFPHHENEIAQSEAATSQGPFVRFWLHHAFLTQSKEKMSKSLGNVLTAREFLTTYSGEFARYVLLSVHYRSVIDFTQETIEQAWSGLERIYRAKLRAKELMKRSRARADLRAETLWGSFVASCEKTRLEMDEHYANDFNIPAVLGSVFSLIREFNRTLAEPLAAATPAAYLGAMELVKVLEDDCGGILGIGRSDPERAIQDLSRMKNFSRDNLSQSLNSSSDLPVEPLRAYSSDEIEELVVARGEAKRLKNFQQADAIRKKLEAAGILIQDGAQGTTWSYK